MRRTISFALASTLTIGGLSLLIWQTFGPAQIWAWGRMIGIGLFFTGLGGVWLWSDFIAPRFRGVGNADARANTAATGWLPLSLHRGPSLGWAVALTLIFAVCFMMAAWKQVALGMAFFGWIAAGCGVWCVQLARGKA